MKKIKREPIKQTDTKNIYFFIYCDPIPKARPRLGRYGAYTPAKTKNAEMLQNLLSRRYSPKAGPISGGVQLILNYYLKPKKTNTAAHINTPDVDNLAKLTMDALSNTLKYWSNDSQINSVLITKQNSTAPGIGVAISFNNLTRPDKTSHEFIAAASNTAAVRYLT